MSTGVQKIQTLHQNVSSLRVEFDTKIQGVIKKFMTVCFYLNLFMIRFEYVHRINIYWQKNQRYEEAKPLRDTSAREYSGDVEFKSNRILADAQCLSTVDSNTNSRLTVGQEQVNLRTTDSSDGNQKNLIVDVSRLLVISRVIWFSKDDICDAQNGDNFLMHFQSSKVICSSLKMCKKFQ